MKNKVPQPLIVKKYENRRLYNTQTSQYINQEQVAQLVREGYDVRVIEAVSGEDITRLVLAQIVLDDAKTPNSVFPLDVLRQMVVASGKATQENTLRYMKAMMEVYQNAYRAMPSPLNGFGFMPGAWMGPQKEASGENSAPGAVPSVSEAPAAEVEELRRRVEELEALLAGSKPRIRSGKTKSRRKS
jgi:polyhydroxyalkanoate synthesis repressor PhaR